MLDQIDRHLIAILQANAREHTTDIAKKLGVARTTVHARIKRLEKRGTIKAYTVVLDDSEHQPKIEAMVMISVDQTRNKEILKRLSELPELKLCLAINGEFDMMLAIEAPQLEDVDELIDEIALIPGVRRTQTSLVLGRKLDRRFT